MEKVSGRPQRAPQFGTKRKSRLEISMSLFGPIPITVGARQNFVGPIPPKNRPRHAWRFRAIGTAAESSQS